MKQRGSQRRFPTIMRTAPLVLVMAFWACRPAVTLDADPADALPALGPDGSVVAAASSAAPAASATPPEEASVAPGCGQNMPEQSCMPGCDSDAFECAVECSMRCGKCEQKCGTAPCNERCYATNDRCRSATCGKAMAACEAKEAADEKRNWGCRISAGDACWKYLGCLSCDQGTQEAKAKCRAACIRKESSGCSAGFLSSVEWTGCTSYGPPPQ